MTYAKLDLGDQLRKSLIIKMLWNFLW